MTVRDTASERNRLARRDARLLLTPGGRRGEHRDQYRIDRARWLYQYGSRSFALKELKDVNDYRDVRRWNGDSKEADLPKSVLRERVGTPVSAVEASS